MVTREAHLGLVKDVRDDGSLALVRASNEQRDAADLDEASVHPGIN